MPRAMVHLQTPFGAMRAPTNRNNRMNLIGCLLLAAAVGGAQEPSHKVVLLDGYHNNETKKQDHYRWEGTDNGGFSELGQMLKGMGAELRTTTTKIDASKLSN